MDTPFTINSFLNEGEVDLLKVICEKELSSNKGIDKNDFRAKHEDYRDSLDRLVQRRVLLDKDNYYRLPLLTLFELSGMGVVKAATLCNACSHVFDVLRRLYKEDTKAIIPLGRLVEAVELSEKEVRRALFYLEDTPIWGSRTTDILNAKDVNVSAGDSILNYKTFEDIITLFRGYREREVEDLKNGPRLHFSQLSSAPLTRSQKKVNYPDWYSKLPTNIRDIMVEVFNARNSGCLALSSMGLRAIIDAVCTGSVGDIGGFPKKLTEMVSGGIITEQKKKTILSVVEFGHASSHRLHVPSEEQVYQVYEIVEVLLKDLYIHPEVSQNIENSVPKRK